MSRNMERKLIAAVAGVMLMSVQPSIGLAAGDHKLEQAPAEFQKMKNPVAVSQDVLDEIKEVYDSRCKKCHGDKGDGKGSGAKDMDPLPASWLTADFAKRPDGQVFWTILNGSKDTEMKAWKAGKAKPGKEVTEEQAWKLVHYIRSLAKK